MSLKLTGKVYIMTMKNDAKIEEELTCQFQIDQFQISTCRFKIDIRNLTNFDPRTQKSEKFTL